MPAWILACLASVECHNKDTMHFILLNHTTFCNLFNDVHPAFNLISANHQSDYVRVRTLSQFGGMYSDADYVGLTSVEILFQHLKIYDWLNEKDDQQGMMTNIAAVGPVRADSLIFAKWLEKIHSLLDDNFNKNTSIQIQNQDSIKKDPIGWLSMTQEIIEPILIKMIFRGNIKYLSFPTSQNFGQLLDLSDSLSSEDKNLKITLKEVPLIHLWNSKNQDRLNKRTLEEVAEFSSESTLLEDIVRFSFWKCFYDRSEFKRSRPVQTDTFELGGHNRGNQAWNGIENTELILEYVRGFRKRYFRSLSSHI